MKQAHGDDYQGALKANFSSNIWYGIDHSALYLHLSNLLPSITRYPEQEARSLKMQLANQLAVDASSIAIGNGSTELIYLLAMAFGRSKSLIVIPTFSEYKAACISQNHTLIYCQTEEMESAIINEQPSLVWICRPNNPDGSVYSITKLEKLVSQNSDTLFVIDQSYADFTVEESIPTNWLAIYPNVVLLHSLTKRFAIPGLRLGYCLANDTIIQKMDRHQIPWSVNTLAIAAGKFLLESNTRLPLSEWLKERDRLMQSIDEIASLQSVNTSTPFFLVKLNLGKAATLKSFLIEKEILVRDATSFEGLNGEYIRINTLSPEQNNLLVTALKEWNTIITR